MTQGVSSECAVAHELASDFCNWRSSSGARDSHGLHNSLDRHHGFRDTFVLDHACLREQSARVKDRRQAGAEVRLFGISLAVETF